MKNSPTDKPKLIEKVQEHDTPPCIVFMDFLNQPELKNIQLTNWNCHMDKIAHEMTDFGFAGVHFATDCTDLISMVTNPTKWPVFASELEDFKSFMSFFLFLVFLITFVVQISVLIVSQKNKSTRYYFLSCKFGGFWLVLPREEFYTQT